MANVRQVFLRLSNTWSSVTVCDQPRKKGKIVNNPMFIKGLVRVLNSFGSRWLFIPSHFALKVTQKVSKPEATDERLALWLYNKIVQWFANRSLCFLSSSGLRSLVFSKLYLRDCFRNLTHVTKNGFIYKHLGSIQINWMCVYFWVRMFEISRQFLKETRTVARRQFILNWTFLYTKLSLSFTGWKLFVHLANCLS